MLRFTITFVIAVLAQAALLFFGDKLTFLGRPPFIIYWPVSVALQPVLTRTYGGHDGNIGPAILCIFIVGTLLYSTLLALAVTWLLPSGSKRKKP